MEGTWRHLGEGNVLLFSNHSAGCAFFQKLPDAAITCVYDGIAVCDGRVCAIRIPSPILGVYLYGGRRPT